MATPCRPHQLSPLEYLWASLHPLRLDLSTGQSHVLVVDVTWEAPLCLRAVPVLMPPKLLNYEVLVR